MPNPASPHTPLHPEARRPEANMDTGDTTPEALGRVTAPSGEAEMKRCMVTQVASSIMETDAKSLKVPEVRPSRAQI
jgi:hypothetical protein